jgi:pyrroline-5-carboxylate reductase
MTGKIKKPQVLVLGYGNMGKALVRGLSRSNSVSLIVFDKDPNSHSDTNSATQDVVFFHGEKPEKIAEKIQLSADDTVIIAVKPHNLDELAKDWKPLLFRDDKSSYPLIISILAGTTTSRIHDVFSGKAPVVRAMPNIAATVDCAATALCASETTSVDKVSRAKEIFDCVGKSWIVPESLLDVVTGLSGSGPAYIYMVIEALSDGGVKMGMPRQLSLALAAQTVLGAAVLVQKSGLHPAVLRDQVTTPGGTTINAIHELEKHGLRPMLISAVVTATRKSASLAKLAQKALLGKSR